ncbi:MAG: sialate O-acetylesterase [Lactobacillus sp.]|uniref:sialate O-acetylesterase n=1 Tax=Lactobacillus sp. TaxID=1591 RepID=UPI0023D44B0D|nr:sialate O-acetylesterase [Lactobacillus sp.]MDE7050064.1 sialate O-acetylesterase [Lactobacillus sp.]
MKLNQNLLADIFQDGMVFPRNKDFKVGGYIDPNQAVEVEFDQKNYLTKSDAHGMWQVILPAVSETSVKKLIVKSNNESQTISDIKFGRVYLLGGQSNIEYRLKDEEHYQKISSDLKSGKYPNLYYYNVPQVDYIDSKTGEVKPKNLQLESWHHINENNAGMVSAIGFYMMMALRESGIKEPLAVVDCFKGGTSASVWIKEADLAGETELKKAFLDKYYETIAGKSWEDFDRETKAYNLTVEKHNQDLAKYLKMHSDTSLSTAKNIVGHTPWPPPYRPDLYTRPSGLNETMLKQIEFGVFNQMIWYQGENDTDRAKYYDKLLPLLLHTWRQTIHDPSLPVKLIQLPGYADYPGDSGAKIRQTQLQVARTIPQVDLVSFIDGGEEHNIHPTNKKITGMRLGKIVAGNDYAGTPYVNKMEVQSKGEKYRLIFNVARCQRLHLEKETYLKISCFDKKVEQIKLSSDNFQKNKLIIDLDELPQEVSYAYENYSHHIGLYNELNYPLSPFRINCVKKAL